MAIRKDAKEEKAKTGVRENLPTNESENKNTSASVQISESSSGPTDLPNPSTDPSTGISLAKTIKEQQASASQILNETKENIARAAQEARTLIPNYAEAIRSCQNQNIQIVKEFAENNIDIQRQLISSFETSWIPYWENTVTSLYTILLSPQRFSDLYTNFLSNYTNLVIAVNRTINYNFLTGMELFKNTLEKAKEASNDLMRASVNLTSLAERNAQKSTEEADTIKATSEVKSESTRS
ncbi:MAG TPA: hypothetical protein VF884_03680 [Nitrososphaeraceae archaeon]